MSSGSGIFGGSVYGAGDDWLDVTPPGIDSQDPAPSGTLSTDGNIVFSVFDEESGVDPKTLQVSIDYGSGFQDAIINGLFQTPFTGGGSVVSGTRPRYNVTIDPGFEFIDQQVVTVQVTVTDFAGNVLNTSYDFTAILNAPPPIINLPQKELRGVLGSIVQIDGRSVKDPSGNPVTMTWSFKRVPIGSELQSEIGVPNSASIVPIRPDHRAISFIPDTLGQYVIGLTADNNASSASEDIVVNIGLTLVPAGEGVIPDMRFIWQYMANFYQLLEDREVFQVVWSSMVQILGADFTALLSNDYNKSLKTIQPNVIRRWQRFSTVTDILNTTQSVILGDTASGTLGETGPLVRTSEQNTKLLRSSESDFKSIDVNYGIEGKVLEIEGRGHIIDRAYNTSSQLASFTAVYKNTTDVTNTTPVTVLEADGDYLYVGKSSPFESINLSIATVSPADLLLSFEYSNGSDGWVSFAPSDGTNGGQQSGEIDLGSIPAWGRNTYSGVQLYWIRIQRGSAAGSAITLSSLTSRVSQSVIVTKNNTIPNNLYNVPYRIAHQLHTPLVNLEEEGVSAGDYLVLEVKRKDTGLTAELPAQVLAVSENRLSFEINLSELESGQLGLELARFEQLVQDLRIITPDQADLEITANAEAFVQFVPTGINVATQPFSNYLFTIRAKRIVRNSKIAIDERYVSIPFLQHEITEEPTLLYENKDYVLLGNFIVFQPNVFTVQNPAPDELWAENTHVNNDEAIESNFGRLVGLTKDDLSRQSTRVPYSSAVKGLWYALTNGPTVSNLRLALHILVGLPFTENRGVVISIDPNYGVDNSSNTIGRILVEDVDEDDQRLGIRRFYFYPNTIGLEINPATGETIKQGDILDAFIPLSKGVTVEDVYSNETWWLRNLKNQELKKFFTFKAELDTETGVFNEDDLKFSVDFLRTIKPAYSNLVASVVSRPNSGDILNNFSESLNGSKTILRFYENVGQVGGHESTFMVDNWNQQGVPLQWLGSRPFQTVSNQIPRDIETSDGGGYILATSSVGFGFNVRGRTDGTATSPALEGDLLILWPNQPGSGKYSFGVYEITEVFDENNIVLGNIPTLSDPTTWALNPIDPATFSYGSGLVGSVIRRGTNPVCKGSDGSLLNAVNLISSASSNFQSDGVQIGDLVIIENGANAGVYYVETTVAQTSPRSHENSEVPQISETGAGLVNIDGTIPTITGESGLSFRVVRPHFRKRLWDPARLVNEGGIMKVEVLDFGQPTEVPFDVFTPDMVGIALGVSNAENSANNGIWTISAYEHAGKVAVTRAGGANTSDAQPQAIINIELSQSWESVEELGPVEYLKIAVA